MAAEGADTQVPASLQTEGKAQSWTSRHVVRHALDSHVYGAQIVGSGPRPPTVLESTQYPPTTHRPVVTSQRAPPGHALSVVHEDGQVAFAPSHANGAHVGAPTDRARRGVQCPIGEEHVSHAPSHARSQQTPSEQASLAQSAPLAHCWPKFVRHVLVASQTLPSAQLSGSSAETTGVHLPGTAEQV